MKELTWKEVFFSLKGLKDLRNEDKLLIPKEYIRSSAKLTVGYAVVFFIMGTISGFYLKGLIP